jgi:hypothetical protein
LHALRCCSFLVLQTSQNYEIFKNDMKMTSAISK